MMDDLSVTDHSSCSQQSSGTPMHIPKKAMQDITFYMQEPIMTTGSGETGVNFSSRIGPESKRMFRAQCSAAEYSGSAGNGFLWGNGSTNGEIAFDLNEPQFPLGCLKDYANRSVNSINTSFRRQVPCYAQEVIDLDGSSDLDIINKDKAASSLGQEVSSTKMGSLCTMKQDYSSIKEAPFDLNVAQPEDLPVPAAGTDVFTSSNSSIASILTSKAKGVESSILTSKAKGVESSILTSKANRVESSILTSKANRVESISKVDFTISGQQGSRCRQNCVGVESSSSQNSNSMVFNETSRSNWKSSLDLNSFKPADHPDCAQVHPNLYGSSETSDSYNATTKAKDTCIEKQISSSDLKKSDTNFPSLSVTAGLQNLPLGMQWKHAEYDNSDEDTVSSKKVHGDQTVQVYPSDLYKRPEQPGRFSTQENSESATSLSVKDDTLMGRRTNQIIKSDTSFVASCSASENPIICPKGPHCDRGLEAKEISLGIDSVVLMAAACLTSMSSANPSRPAYGFKEVHTSGIEIGGNDQPQCSSDSLELIVLSLPELREEACSPPVRPQVEEPVKSVRRYNSRRGRQLRDFQRDVLPGLVSLSRHEICEDMHAFAEISRLYDNKRKETTSGYTCRRNRSAIARNRRPRCRALKLTASG